MEDGFPSADPADHVVDGLALGSFYDAWVGPMERHHETFSSDFMRDDRYPGIVRVAMVLCPFVQTALSGRWHILDQNEAAAHNDRGFRLQRRLALMLHRHRSLDPLACDLLVAMLKVNELKQGNHPLISRDYEPYDDLAELLSSRVYAFADGVFRSLRRDEDLAAYELPTRFSWPAPPAVEAPGRPVIRLPRGGTTLDAFDLAAARALAEAMHEAGHPVSPAAAAAKACMRDGTLLSTHSDIMADGGILTGTAAADAVTRARHESSARSPQGILGLPKERYVVAVVTKEAHDRLAEMDRSEVMASGFGMLSWLPDMPSARPQNRPFFFQRHEIDDVVCLASDPTFDGGDIDVVTLRGCGMTLVIADDDPARTAAIVARLDGLLRAVGAPPVVDCRMPDPARTAH